ncbi:oligomeric Golgi complex component [Heterostelium album PN500]|uniref:Conserved oligomeric Golgi complex subunit 8 n=1 Tax=Heterostelium pallidum (strain ATCC 26659 / Pp 5 / PN500) TaxID=670386 RepID=D3BUW3_HETP5|nr:oligomeric Golgi complex component [Heterostelium album PN500]EFA74901.1 oligomeric Golgi complex component [Heterostelium album PN500]|eukprot:XP_020427035.1 oligomeric Golgi complex component [Heterostelium album PN500]
MNDSIMKDEEDEDDFYRQQNGSSNSSNSNATGGVIYTVESLQSEMNSYSLEKLMKEPQLLAKHKQHTIGQMKSLALQHYQLFIDNYNTLNFTQNQMDTINDRVDSLLDHLQSISTSCESFSTISNQLTVKRASVKNLLDNFPTILDLLEIPQLMDTCVKNGYYDEALQLESYAKKISKQYPNIKVINEIIIEVQKSTQSLIANLQQQLKGNISLTDCIRTIGFLRRLSIYRENELKTILLHTRDQWLMNSIKFINDSNPVSYLTKLTDCCRTNIFDIVTQFSAIFSDESDDDSQLDDLILNGWVQQKIQMYLTTLERTLPLVKEGSSIAYILENAMYYSMSMSRVGIDFRGLLLPIFEKVITSVFLSHITTATHHFLEALKSYRFQQIITKESNYQSSSSSSNHLSPPNTLLQHPPLAILTNSFISSYIELKECAPLSLEYPLSLKLRDTIVTLTSGVLSFYNQSSLTSSQHPVFNAFSKCLVEDFLPFIISCFDSIFCNTSKIPLIDISGIVIPLIKIYEPTKLEQNHRAIDEHLKASNNTTETTTTSPIPTPTTPSVTITSTSTSTSTSPPPQPTIAVLPSSPQPSTPTTTEIPNIDTITTATTETSSTNVEMQQQDENKQPLEDINQQQQQPMVEEVTTQQPEDDNNFSTKQPILEKTEEMKENIVVDEIKSEENTLIVEEQTKPVDDDVAVVTQQLQSDATEVQQPTDPTPPVENQVE